MTQKCPGATIGAGASCIRGVSEVQVTHGRSHSRYLLRRRAQRFHRRQPLQEEPRHTDRQQDPRLTFGGDADETADDHQRVGRALPVGGVHAEPLDQVRQVTHASLPEMVEGDTHCLPPLAAQDARAGVAPAPPSAPGLPASATAAWRGVERVAQREEPGLEGDSLASCGLAPCRPQGAESCLAVLG